MLRTTRTSSIGSKRYRDAEDSEGGEDEDKKAQLSGINAAKVFAEVNTIFSPEKYVERTSKNTRLANSAQISDRKKTSFFFVRL